MPVQKSQKSQRLKDPFADAEEAEFYGWGNSSFEDPDGFSQEYLDDLIDMISEELDNV